MIVEDKIIIRWFFSVAGEKTLNIGEINGKRVGSMRVAKVF